MELRTAALLPPGNAWATIHVDAKQRRWETREVDDLRFRIFIAPVLRELPMAI
jgi:hypothetical protein